MALNFGAKIYNFVFDLKIDLAIFPLKIMHFSENSTQIG